MDNKKRKKFNVGDILKVKGEDDLFEIVAWFYESSFEGGSFYERVYYTGKGKSTGKVMDFINVNDPDVEVVGYGATSMSAIDSKKEDTMKEAVKSVKTPKKAKKISSEEIDQLLDLYNDYEATHQLLKHLGIQDDVEYKIKSQEEVIELLRYNVTKV